MTPLTEHQVFEYESGKTTFIQSCINNWFPKYFIWKVKQRYKRYLWFMEYRKKVNNNMLANFIRENMNSKIHI